MIGSLLQFGVNMAAYAASKAAVIKTAQAASSAFRTVAKTANNYLAKRTFINPKATESLLKMTANEGSAVRKFFTKSVDASKTVIERRTSPAVHQVLKRSGNLLKEEAMFMPANYVYYRMEKHRAVSPEEKAATSSFAKYYFGAPMLMSMGMGVAMDKVPGISRTALKHIMSKTSNRQREFMVKGIAGAARAGAEITDRAIAAARAARVKTGSAGITSMFSFGGLSGRNKEAYSVLYSKELSRLKREPVLYSKRQMEMDSFNTRIDAELKKQETHLRKIGRYDATKDAYERVKKEISEETHSGYRQVMEKPNSFMNMMNWMADNLNDSRFRTTRKTLPGERGIPTDFGKYVIGGTDVDFGRMNAAFMKDIMIKTATNGRNPISATINLFGQRDILKYKGTDHEVGLAFTKLNRGSLYVGRTYDYHGKGLDRVINEIVGIDPLEQEIDDGAMKTINGFRKAQRKIVENRYGEALKGIGSEAKEFEIDRILGKAYSHGQIFTKSGDFMVHFPGGKLKLYSSFRNEEGAIEQLSFQLGKMDSGEYLNYYKFSKQGITNGTRYFYGQEDLNVGGQKISVGPAQIGKVERMPGDSLWDRIRNSLDIGYSNERWLGTKVTSIYKKFRDPRYAKTFFDKSYIGNPEIQNSISKELSMQIDLAGMLRRESSDSMEHFVASMTRRAGGTDAFLSVMEKGESTGEFAKKFMIADNMSSHDAKTRITEFSKLLSEMSDYGTDNTMVAGQRKLVNNIRTAFLESQENQRVYETLEGINTSKTQFIAGKRRELTKVDEYNALVLATNVGLPGNDRSTINHMSRMFSLNHANEKEISEFAASAHMSQFHHRMNHAISKRQEISMFSGGAESVRDSENAVSELLRMYSDPNGVEYNTIGNYYKKSWRHSDMLPHDIDPRLRVEDPFEEEVFAMPKGMGTGIIRKRKLTDGSEIAEGIMDAGNTAVMNMLYSFNNVAAQALGLGMDETKISTPGLFIKSMVTKRILPGMAAYMGYNVLDRFADKTMDGTPLGEGITVFGANILAGARVASANILDELGVTDTAKYLENLMPGFIESPLSGITRFAAPVALGLVKGGKMGGVVGSLTGGMIGTAVGALLGGGPLGLFGQWNINKSREEVVNVLSGREEVAIKKGRWWELGRCFTPDSNIPSIYDLPAKASEITTGKMIVSPYGTQTKVLNVFEREYTGETFRITTYNNQTETIIMTGNHNIPILRKHQGQYLIEEAPVESLNPWDFIEIPIYHLPEHETSITTKDYLDPEKTIIQNGRIYKSQTNWFTKKKQRSGTHSLPEKIELSYDLGKLFGYFLAEGNLFQHSNSGEWHAIEMVHALGETDIVEDIQRISEEVFGTRATVRKKTTGKLTKEGCYITRICSSVATALFYSLLYDNKYNDKFIPRVFMDANREFKEGLIHGYWKGDGHYQFNRNTISSARYSLIYQSYMILSSLGRVATIPKKEENGFKGKYRISWNPGKSIHDKNQYFIYHEDRLYSKVADIIKEEYSGKVYDFEVDNDRHLFVAGGILIHNSAFEGTRTEYFRPHMYAMLRANYKDTPGYKDSFLKDTVGALVPDIYAMQNYYSRPYPVTAGVFSDIPVVSSVMGMLPGFPLGAGIPMHQNDWSTRYQKGVATDNGMTIGDIASTYGSGTGYFSSTSPGDTGSEMDTSVMPIENPMQRSSFDYSLGESMMNIKDIVGMRGFIMGSTFEGVTGRKDLADYAPEMASPVDIAGVRRSYWDQELGGMLGMSEIIRRYIPRRRSQMEIFNPLINAMPDWLPNEDYMTDFQHGDPFCLSSDTLVDTNKGYIRAEDVTLDHQILSHKANLLPVKRIVKRKLKENEKAYSFTISGIDSKIPLEFSEDHPLWIKRINKCSFGSSCYCRKEIRNHNGFCDNHNCSKKNTHNPISFISAKMSKQGDVVVFPIPKPIEGFEKIQYSFTINTTPRGPKESVSDYLYLTPDISWILGLYLAEGSTAKKKGKPVRLIFSLHKDETDVISKVVGILESLSGKTPKIKVRGNSADIILCDSRTARIFDSIIPGNLYTKRIPTEFFLSNSENKLSFILGFMLGDGTVSRNTIIGFTAGKELAYDLHKLCMYTGIPAGLTIRNTRKAYQVSIHTFHLIGKDLSYLMYKKANVTTNFTRQPNLLSWTDGNYIYSVITEKKEVKLDYVYGFEIDTDDTFCVIGFATHNTKVAMGEARLPGAAYETMHDVDLDLPIEGDILEESFESQMNFFLGLPEYMVPRKRKTEIAKNVADGMRENARQFGDLVKGHAAIYNAKHNVRATVDAIVRGEGGQRVAVKVAPEGFGGGSSLNAFLAMSEMDQGLLMEVNTETGDVTQKIIKKDIDKFASDLQ